jgi:site-specific DNA-methyltransferase (adenine-specific)
VNGCAEGERLENYGAKKIFGMIEFKHGDCLELLKDIKSESVDCILTDPPYKYLKNQKLEVDFDEKVFFNEAKRVLKKSGFIVLFGRGTSFYRWNTMLADLGFVFKEEVVWNKRQNSIPAAPLHRIHETISIHTVKSGKLIITTVPYIERKQYDIESIIQDVKRIGSALKSDKEVKDIMHFLETGEIIYTDKKFKNFFNHAFTDRSRGAATIKSIVNGVREKWCSRWPARDPAGPGARHSQTSRTDRADPSGRMLTCIPHPTSRIPYRASRIPPHSPTSCACPRSSCTCIWRVPSARRRFSRSSGGTAIRR